MLRIAIIDDEAGMRSRLREMLCAISPEYAVRMEIQLFSSGGDFIRFLQEQKAAQGSHAYFDLLFLDIEMEGKSGIEVGQYIRQELHDDKLQIVYISAHTQYSLALHRFHPLHFLIKDITPADLREVLAVYCNMQRDERQYFCCKIGRDVLQIEVRQIRYLKANNREITVYLEGSDNAPFNENTAHKCIYPGKLSDAFRQLQPCRFLDVHRSYLVNPAYIRQYQYDSVILWDGTEIPIGVTKRKEIRQKQMEAFGKEGDADV